MENKLLKKSILSLILIGSLASQNRIHAGPFDGLVRFAHQHPRLTIATLTGTASAVGYAGYRWWQNHANAQEPQPAQQQELQQAPQLIIEEHNQIQPQDPQEPNDLLQIRAIQQQQMEQAPEEQNICPICQAPQDATIIALPCSPVHRFHRACISSWLQQHPTCPICRAQVNAEWASEHGFNLPEPNLPEQEMPQLIRIRRLMLISGSAISIIRILYGYRRNHSYLTTGISLAINGLLTFNNLYPNTLRPIRQYLHIGTPIILTIINGLNEYRISHSYLRTGNALARTGLYIITVMHSSNTDILRSSILTNLTWDILSGRQAPNRFNPNNNFGDPVINDDALRYQVSLLLDSFLR